MNKRYEELIIGEGEIGIEARSTQYPNIAENKDCYWISNCLDLRLKMYVVKGTIAANDLKRLLDANKPYQDYLDKLYLEFVDPEILKDAIAARCKESFEQGKLELRRQVQELLGMNQSF